MEGDKRAIKCDRCAAVLSNVEAFETHQNTFHTTLYNCRYCPKQFIQSQSLASHCRVAHSDAIKKRQKLLSKKGASLKSEQCKRCEKAFTSPTQLKVHMKKHHTEDDQKVPKKEKLKHHEMLSAHEPSFEVYIDTCGTDDPEHYKTSTSTFQLNSAESRTMVNDRGRTPMRRTVKKRGKYGSISENDDARIPKVRKSTGFKQKILRSKSGLYRCKYCSKTFALSTCLASHVRCHYSKLQEGSIKCGTCSISVSTMAELRTHVNKLHINCRSYCCGLCGYLTNQIGKFRLHLLYTHMQIQYTCTICSRQFSTKVQLKKHNLREHAVKKQPIPMEVLRCRLCKFECYTEDELEVHQKVHIRKLNKCNMCDYECYSKHLLTRHEQQTHFGPTQNPCEIMKNDAEVSHVDTTMPSAELLPFSCGMCGSKFPKTEYLLHHITVHIEGKYIFKRKNSGSVLSSGSSSQSKSSNGQVSQEKRGYQENMSCLKQEATANSVDVSKGKTSSNHNHFSSNSYCSDNLEDDKTKVISIQNESVHSRAQKLNSPDSYQSKPIVLPKALKDPIVEGNNSSKFISDDYNDVCPSTGWLTDQYTSKPWFECPHCFQFVENAKDFQKHIAAHGSKSLRSLVCGICKRRFASKTSLHRHKTNHRCNEYQCKCGKEFVSSTQVMAHIKHCNQAGC